MRMSVEWVKAIVMVRVAFIQSKYTMLGQQVLKSFRNRFCICFPLLDSFVLTDGSRHRARQGHGRVWASLGCMSICFAQISQFANTRQPLNIHIMAESILCQLFIYSTFLLHSHFTEFTFYNVLRFHSLILISTVRVRGLFLVFFGKIAITDICLSG